MAEDIQGLIEKIQQDGIKVAEAKAREIEAQVQRRAEAIVAKAEKEAEGIIAQAQGEVRKLEASGKVALEQAGRDLLLALRTEINAMLDKVIVAQVRETMSIDQMSEIIVALIKELGRASEGEIVISLKESDLKKLEKDLLGRLTGQLKKEVTLKPAKEISGGFIISYDGGKSHYDFSDQAIAEYLSAYLRPRLAEILKVSASGGKNPRKNT